MMKCSVLLPVFNGAPTLRPAIESILAQTENAFEFIIIDDCSADGSTEVIREYMRNDSRICGVFHGTNAGLSSTLNEGLRLARTDLVVRMDQDDISLPDRLKCQIRFMRTRPDVGAAGSYVYHMGRDASHDLLIKPPAHHNEIMSILPQQNCMYHSSMILRRIAVLDVGGYRNEFRNAEDYDLWLRLSRSYRLANLEVPLLRYRFSTSGMSLSERWQQMLYVQMALVSYRNPTLRDDQLKRAALDALERVDKADYLEHIAKNTISELVRLGDWPGASSAFRLFARSADHLVTVRLAYHMMKCAVKEAIDHRHQAS